MPRTNSGNRARRRPPNQAELADKHELYELAVQDPRAEVKFVSQTFRKLRGRRATSLREDFCGTGVFSSQWVRSHADRRAVGLDIDAATLNWGRENRISQLTPSQARRVELRQADVLDHDVEPVDVGVAFNFSYWVFKTRARMLAYFRRARTGLVDDGVFFLDILGGTEVPAPYENEHEHDDFVYRWEHLAFDPLTNGIKCQISFEFDDGSQLAPAFEYDWRMWSIPELRDILEEAGFQKLRVFWEREDEEGEGTGKFFQPKRVDNDPVWWAYLAAEC